MVGHVRRGDDGVIVDLVDEDAGVFAAGPVEQDGPEGSAGVAWARRRGRRLGVAAVVVLAVVAVVVGTVTATAERAEQARWDALVDQGVTPVDLALPLAEAWRVEGGARVVVTAGDVVVLASGLDGPAPVLHAYDTTGRLRWGREGSTCREWSGSDENPLLLCVTGRYRGGLPDTYASCRVELVDARDGAVRSEVTVPGALETFSEIDTDVLLTTVGADGRADVVRADPATGTVRWTAEGERVVAGPPGQQATVWTATSGDVVVLGDPEGTVAFDARTGEPTHEPVWGAATVTVQEMLPDGSFLRTEVSAMGQVTVVDAAGAGDGPVVQVGDLALTGGRATVVVDRRTGEERWRRTPDVTFAGVATDGTRVLGVSVEDGGTWLVALDLESGDELWRTPTVSAPREVRAIPGGVVVTGASAVALYR